MRTTLLAILLSTTSAFAADMGVLATERPPTIKAAPPPPSIPPWTGFYLGINGGYAFGTATQSDNTISVPGFLIVNPFDNPKPSGFLLGGHAGWNYQWQSLVGGLELDYDAANLTDKQNAGFALATLTAKIDALASVRGRVGILAIPEVLIYGTGGPAWAHASATGTFGGASEEVFVSANGWVAGGGVEWMVDPRVLLRLEGLHFDFPTTTFPFVPINGPAVTAFIPGAASLSVNVARGALSYRF